MRHPSASAAARGALSAASLGRFRIALKSSALISLLLFLLGRLWFSITLK